MKIIIAFLILTVSSTSSRILSETIILFNGENLDNWEIYVPQARLNIDSRRVFSVVKIDGKPAIKVSGEHFGGISTFEEYSNYHLSLEFKWGEAKYAPKLGQKRDSGLLYHGVGEQGTLQPRTIVVDSRSYFCQWIIHRRMGWVASKLRTKGQGPGPPASTPRDHASVRASR